MKIADYISKCIQEYPSLYKDVDYEKSKLKVLCQIFFTNGNGLKMADTENPKEGGYVVEPKYKKDKKTDNWIRIKDKPYGKEKYKPIPDGYFESIVYYVYAIDHPIEIIYRKEQHGDDKIYFRYDKKVDNKFRQPKLYKAESLHQFSPYPFSKEFSIACDVFYDGVFLQEDWMQELIILCKRTLEYFNDKNQYKNYCYYPTENKIKQDVNYFKERFNKDGVKGVTDLRKFWDYEVKETLPDYAEIENRKNSIWQDFHKKQIQFLTDFLSKFGYIA